MLGDITILIPIWLLYLVLSFKNQFRSLIYILYRLAVLHSAVLKLTEMWPTQQWIPRGGASTTTLQCEEYQVDRTKDQNFWVLTSSLLATKPVTSVPGEISISTRDSFDFSSLMTKADSIRKSAKSWIPTCVRRWLFD